MKPNPGTLLPPGNRDPFASPGRSLRGRGHQSLAVPDRLSLFGGGAAEGGQALPVWGGRRRGLPFPVSPAEGAGKQGRLSLAAAGKVVPRKKKKEASGRWQAPHPHSPPLRPRNFLPPEERENEGGMFAKRARSFCSVRW